MKSLSDYTTLLRNIAKNLNLHGESVEMVVQMLANSLFISEVEHIAYSQEASLERATEINSKIQHCVNQMYSVFRGSNPRVIINLKASKLFSFKPHQEIIKSNNYQVYYIGYFNETTETIQYSDLTVYPETTVTIIGIMSKNVNTYSWNVTSGNPYYYTIPTSDLSGDLYLDISGVRTEVTRIFSDHLRKNIPFDLTLPGYGLRLYYPESFQGTAGINKDYYLSVYGYMPLSSISESEKKALKMVGSTVREFGEDRNWILKKLNAKESYPGLIFIPETPRDAIETIHHKANKYRYSGTYLATNSDLSWMLQEYYPEKIRRLGVTYRFESPKSTSLETLTRTKELSGIKEDGVILKFEDVKNDLKDWILKDYEFLPPGEIKFKYRQTKEPVGANASYEILPSVSVIPVRASFISNSDPRIRNYIYPTISDITVRVLKNIGGQVKLLTTPEELLEEGLEVSYRFTETMPLFMKLSRSLVISSLESHINSISDKPLEILLTCSGKQVDKESIPFTYIPVTIGKVEINGDPSNPSVVTESYMTVTEEGPGDYYTLDLMDDTVYLKTSDTGEILEESKTSVSLYYNGKKIEDGVSYSLITSSDIEAYINPETGDIEITGISEDVVSGNLIVKAKYNGMNFQSLLTCRKTISNVDSSGILSSFSVYSDLSETYPIGEFQGQTNIQEATIQIPKNSYKSIKMVTEEDISIQNMEYSYSWEVLSNLIPSGYETTPTLHLYYIPYSESNPLNIDEITKFVDSNKSYYITQNIEISPGREIIAKFDISLDLYKNTSLDETILDILDGYSYQFGEDFGNSEIKTDAYSEIKSLITKISEVRNVIDIKVSYLDPTSRKEVSYDEITESDTPVYFAIESVISSIVRE